jgi:hypothetical protein
VADGARSLSVQLKLQKQDVRLHKQRGDSNKLADEKRKLKEEKLLRQEEMMRSYQGRFEGSTMRDSEKTMHRLRMSEENGSFIGGSRDDAIERQRRAYFARKEAIARKHAEEMASIEETSLHLADHHVKVEEKIKKIVKELADETAFRKEHNELRHSQNDKALSRLEVKRRQKIKDVLKKFEDSQKRIADFKSLRLKSIELKRKRNADQLEEIEEGRRKAERMLEYRQKQTRERLKAAEVKAQRVEEERARRLKDSAKLRDQESSLIREMTSHLEQVKARKLQYLSLNRFSRNQSQNSTLN